MSITYKGRLWVEPKTDKNNVVVRKGYWRAVPKKKRVFLLDEWRPNVPLFLLSLASYVTLLMIIDEWYVALLVFIGFLSTNYYYVFSTKKNVKGEK